MATLLPRAPGSKSITILSANVAEELTFDGKPPKKITLEFETNTGGYDFTGPAGADLSSGSRIDVVADSPYVVELRQGMARHLDMQMFIEVDTASTVVNITVE